MAALNRKYFTLLWRSLFHLVRNAIEATPVGGRIAVTTMREGDKVILTISDTGSGIPAEDIDKIFEVGLPLVKQIISEHLGKIEVKSKPEKGTTFEMVFPVRWGDKK